MKDYGDGGSLLKRLVMENDLDQDQAVLVLHLVSEYAKEQLPVLRGNIQLFVQSELNQLEKSKLI